MKCPYCGSEDIVMNQDGEYVCRACGVVLGQSFAPPITTVRMHVVGTTQDFTDIKLHSALGEVMRLRHILNLPEGCVKEATRLIEFAIRGRKISVVQPEALAVATLLYGCRQAGTPVSLKVLIQHVAVRRGTIKQAIWEFNRLLPVRYVDVLIRTARTFGISQNEVLQLWTTHRRRLVGRSPRVVAAALIYLASRNSLGLSEVAHRLGVTVNSVRQMLKRLS